MARQLMKYRESSRFSDGDRQTFRDILASLRMLQLPAAARTFSWWLHNDGWRFSPYQIYERHVSGSFDQEHGTDTLTRVDLTDLEIDSPNRLHGVYYQASPVCSTRKLLRSLGIRHEEFTFVDFGSGKGRILLLASELPFKHVIGVEFGSELHACAQRNISVYRNSIAKKVESMLCDATQFNIPPGNVVLYFFNPFNEIVLAKVLDNILSSLKEQPRRALVIYRYLPDNALFKESDGFFLTNDWHRYRVYEWKDGRGVQWP